MAEFQNRIAIAYADTFFVARKRLPNAVLPDLFNFIEKFTNDPTARGLNYEKLAAIDSCLRSARINGSYRAIIRIPNDHSKNVYALLWVDSHDAAYSWAKRKRINVNPITNAVEIYDTISIEEIDEKILINSTEEKLFDYIRDKEFEQINIPTELLFIIRSIQKEEDLEKSKPFLPIEVFENLSYLAAGFPLNEVAQMVTENAIEYNRQKKTMDQAIADPKNRNQFYVVDRVEGMEELKQILDTPLEEWRIFLHPLQRSIVEKNFFGPAKVLGGAGTGKTVVAMHRAKWLAEKVFNKQGDKILFTTFTSNLAEDISMNLKKMCKLEVYSKIEIVNLDKWISNFLRRNCIQERLIFGDEVKQMWENVIINRNNDLELPIAFYIEEYEKVVLANEVSSFDEYRFINRTGRGIALNREQKLKVWGVIEAYINLMKRTNTIDGASAAIKAKNIILNSNSVATYKAVIVDEGQDFGAASLKLIRAIAGREHENDIFIVGDAHQRIYGKKAVLKDCGINTIGRSGTLKINYRTTEEIRRFSQKIIKGLKVDDLDDGVDEGKGYLSLTRGKEPIVLNFNSVAEENEKIYEIINRWTTLNIDSSSICIVARTNKQLNVIRKFLLQKCVKLYEIKNMKSEDKSISGVRIATMHRVKGLEFDCVIIAGVNDGVMPLNKVLDTATDAVRRRELYDTERSLLYVAATRAKKELVVTSFGKISEVLQDIC